MGNRGEVPRGAHGAFVWLMLVVALAASNAFGGFALTVENDCLTGSDDSYTHGTELAWFHNETNHVAFEGLRSRIYTPKDISVAENQPGDRPWCGVTTVFMEKGFGGGLDRYRWGLEMGVLGPSSKAAEQQKWFHELIGGKEPMGWGNQMADEPVLNVYADVWREVLGCGISGDWTATVDALGGGVVGTMRVDTYVGAGARAGWNVPSFWPGGIDPKVVRARWFSYGLVECKGRLVAHNATLGHSLFRDYDGDHKVSVESTVGEAKYGLCGGWGDFSLVYLRAWRTDEFEGQDDSTDWGEVRLTFGRAY